MPTAARLLVAACQYAPQVGDLAGNRALSESWIRRAAAAGARLIVLPELAASGYTFQSEAEAAACGEPVSGASVSRWVELCRELGVHLVAGFAEAAAGRRYNAAAVVGPEGTIGVYRKAHLFNDEKSYFDPGDSGFLVFDLPGFRLGVLICYDLWFPEAARVLALRGADVVCVPTNWVANFRSPAVDQRGWTMGDYASVGIATQNQVFVVAADRIGRERGVEFVGCSCVVAPNGEMLAGPGQELSEELLLADLDLGWAARARRRTPRNHTLEDRRPELYLPLTEELGA
ncbi:MAG: nitrilase-related carbon-nitrogen hydrolase [Candidatus Dormiibacterota bacterium]